MRRSAAALLARPHAPPAPPPTEGLEAVRATAAAARRAVDDKLAAVRAAVLDGRVAQPAGPGPMAGAHGGAGMRRSGSDPVLCRRVASPDSDAAFAAFAGGDTDGALLPSKAGSARGLGPQARHCSCPSLVLAVAVTEVQGATSKASPRQPASQDGRFPWRGGGDSRSGSGDGDGGEGSAAGAACKHEPWRWRQLPPAIRGWRLRLPPSGPDATPSPYDAGGKGPTLPHPSWRPDRPPDGSVTLGGGGGGDDDGAGLWAAEHPGRAGRWLSPLRAGPTLTGRAGR